MQKGIFSISTSKKMEFADITSKIAHEISNLGVESGVCFVYNPHTTAGLTINEGADPAVQEDIISVLKEIVPQKFHYKHLEGNSPSHVKASLMGSSISVFIENGELQLGTWQRIFFCEFDGPRTRKVYWKVL